LGTHEIGFATVRGQETGQFGAFDGRDNRRTILDCFRRMGGHLSEELAGMRRAGFLQGLLVASDTGFAQRPIFVDPCSAVEAYYLFVHMTGCLGIPIEKAALMLEEVVRRE
jgi:hypothetical protein